MSCFDLTHAPVATAARAAATGLVSMSTRPDPKGSGTVEIATRRRGHLRVVWDLRELTYYKKKQAMEPSRQTWSSYGPPYLPVGALVLRSNPCHFPRDRNISSRVYIYILRIDMCRLFLLYLVLQLYCIVVIPGMKHI